MKLQQIIKTVAAKMTQAMIIFSLLTYFILAVDPQVGNEQSQKIIRLELASKFELNPTSNLPFYACKFMYTVDCLWQLNGTTIQPHMYNYSYVKNNGMTTDDCTIQGNTNTKKIYKDKANNDNVTCIGNAKEDSKKLTCKLSKPGTCTWKRNDQTIKIDGKRYKYVQQHNGTNAQDCSIIIERVQSIDYTKWECSPIATDSNNPSKPVIHHLSKSSLTGGKNTSNINSTNSPPNIATSAAPDFNNQTSIKIALGITCAVAAVLGTVLFYLCRQQKRHKNQTVFYPAQNHLVSSTVVSDNTTNPVSTETEPVYVNISSPNLPEPQPEAPQPEEPIYTSTPRPRSTIDNDYESTQVIYTQVIISKTTSASTGVEIPHTNVGGVSYATIIHKRLSQDLPML